MKKSIVIIFIILISICGYYYIHRNNKTTPINEPSDIEIDNEEEEIKEPDFIDDNPLTIGLYKEYRDEKKRKLITNDEEKWLYHKDISCYEVYYTLDEELNGTNQIKLFGQFQSNYSNIDNYRIGYNLVFKINEEEINKTILKPQDTTDFYEYLEVYLYDDYHQNGGWYSHVTDKEFNGTTLLTSIKLTAGKRINEITSDISLTAFTYDEDDFDELGNYKGISKYTINIKRII